ncbi:MAG: DUF5011 domain-containing protein [bacterium]|nr:DUF5011 domain-containing protein [bacterium]
MYARLGNYILKYTTNGQFVSFWGGAGDGPGELHEPWDIAVSAAGEVHVADHGNKRVQVFDSNGEYLREWGTWGSGPGQFGAIRRLALNSLGDVYVADPDNSRIQKFDSQGNYLLEWASPNYGITSLAVNSADVVYVVNNQSVSWYDADGTPLGTAGSHGTGSGQLTDPHGIAFDSVDNFYVADRGNFRITKFDPDGNVITQWGEEGYGDGQLGWALCSIAISDDDKVYVGDGVVEPMERHRIQVFTSDGGYLGDWTAAGTRDGLLCEPSAAAVDEIGDLYIADAGNSRIQKFTADGQHVLSWGTLGSAPGQFHVPCGVASDGEGYIYVTEQDNHRVQKFTLDGVFVRQWGGHGTGPGQFGTPRAVAVAPDGSVYVADGGSVNFPHSGGNDRIQKFTPDGVFLLEWGEPGSGYGQFASPSAVAVDSAGCVYVSEALNNRVQKFSSDGVFLQAMTVGLPDQSILSMAMDTDNTLCAATWGKVYRYSTNGDYLGEFSEKGIEPGQTDENRGMAADGNGAVFTVDTTFHRVQKFVPMRASSYAKAIIVAGGGAFPGNSLWDATQSCANFAYRALTYQGFTKETIYYLSSDTDLDLDNNGVADDVDGDATNANLQYALETWAGALHNGLPTGDVVVYLVDHGGPGTFRMSGLETLTSTEFAAWLDTLQGAVSGTVTVVYDACESGTFIADCVAPSGYQDKRVVATSTSPGESAYFVTRGTVSFSNYFWTQIFNGVPVGDAFDLASQALSETYDYQTPLLEDNGNAVANDGGDGALAATTYIGNGVQQFWEGPEIGAVVGTQTIDGTSTATLWADPVTDDDGVARVWAVIRPPDYEQESSSNPVAGLPTIDLQPATGDRFEADYDAFTTPGTYTVLIYARDRVGNTSVPVMTSVSVTNPLKRRAVLVAGGTTSDVDWPAYERTVTVAYDALRFQGYDDEDIYFMSPMGLAGVDVAPSVSNIQWALSVGQNTMTQDMMLYLVGPGSASGFMVSGTEVLDAPTLDTWLDTLQATIPGTITVVYDADQSGVFLPDLTAPTGYEDKRIAIASASSSQQAAFLRSGTISFSQFFWVRVLNGADTFEAWVYAMQAMKRMQTAMLDDSGDGTCHPVYDGIVSRDHYIGMGILLAGDDPLIGSIVAAQDLTATDTATLWVDDVTTTGVIDRVWAVVTLPDNDVTTVELLDVGGGRYEAAWSGFSVYGTYGVAAFATDTEGNVSAPAETEVRRLDGPDAYEDDDTAAAATWTGLVYAGGTVQTHNFHDAGDADWVAFDSTAGTTITIETLNCGSNCNTWAQLYRADGTSLIDDDAWGLGEYSSYIAWTVDTDGRYLVRVSHILGTEYGADTNYDLRMWQETGPCGVVPTLTVTVRSTMGAVALAGVPVKVTVFGGFPTPAVYTNSLGQALFPGIASYATYNVAITDGDYVPYTNSVYVPCSPYTAHAVQLTPLVTPPVLQVTSLRSVGAPTGAATFDVANTGADTLNWSANVQGGAASWLTIDSGASGVDAGSIGVSCTANSASTSRNGYLLVTATDSGGGTAVNSPVEVQVHQSGDTEAPIITVLGDNPVTLDVDATYTDEGATAVDAVCGALTGSILTTGTVDTSYDSTWTITYTVSDTAGHVCTASRTVIVGSGSDLPLAWWGVCLCIVAMLAVTLAMRGRSLVARRSGPKGVDL